MTTTTTAPAAADAWRQVYRVLEEAGAVDAFLVSNAQVRIEFTDHQGVRRFGTTRNAARIGLKRGRAFDRWVGIAVLAAAAEVVNAAAPKARKGGRVRWLARPEVLAHRDAALAAALKLEDLARTGGDVAEVELWIRIGEGTTAYAADNHVYDINKGRAGDAWEGFEARRRDGVGVEVRYVGVICD